MQTSAGGKACLGRKRVVFGDPFLGFLGLEKVSKWFLVFDFCLCWVFQWFFTAFFVLFSWVVYAFSFVFHGLLIGGMFVFVVYKGFACAQSGLSCCVLLKTTYSTHSPTVIACTLKMPII